IRSDVAFLLAEIAKRDATIAALKTVKGVPRRARPPAFDPHVDRIVRVVAVHFGVHHHDVYGKERWRLFAYPRHAAMLIARDSLKRSLPELGAAFGGRDHSTVMASCEKARKLLETDQRFRAAFEASTSALAPRGDERAA